MPEKRVFHIAKSASIRQLYTGVGPPLVGGALEAAINFGVFAKCMRSFGAHTLHSGERPALATAASASISGVALSFALSPVELIKVRQQAGLCTAGAWHCLHAMMKHEGVFASLSRGLLATIVREGIGNMVIFTAYDSLLRNTQALPETLQATLCGGLSGIAFYACVLPVDAIKTRIQIGASSTAQDRSLLYSAYALIAGCHTHKQILSALYPGIVPVLARAFPVNAVGWWVYEVSLRLQAEDGKPSKG